MTMFQYKTRGTCSQFILIEADGDILTKVEFVGGCTGNTQGVASLVRGMKIDEVISRQRSADVNSPNCAWREIFL